MQPNYRNSSRGVEMSSSNDTINAVVVYHSGYGHTKRMAEAVADGAGAVLFAIDADGVLPEAGWSALDAADAIISGHPHIWADQAGNSRSSPMKL
jgi:flavorubredoxin